MREIDPSGEWALVDGSDTGAAVSELTVVEPPISKDPPVVPRKPSVPNPFQPIPPKPQNSGPFISFPLTADNVVELRLSSRISKKDFDRFKKLIDLFEESLVEPEGKKPSGIPDDL